MSRVLITGARAPIALDLARSFAAAGHEPHLADTVTPFTAALSRTVRGRIHRFAPPRTAFADFRSDLLGLIEKFDPIRVVPTCEEVFFLAAAAARDGWAERLFAPDLQTLGRLHSKVEFAALARTAGVETPETVRVTGRGRLKVLTAGLTPRVLKPEFSRFATHALVKPSADAIARLDPSPAAPWAVQTYVAGEEICIWSAAVNGRITAIAAYRPSWRVGRSSSYYFERDDDPAALDLARRIAAATGASGHLSFDAIRRADGVLVPIECNPRGVSGLHLFGADPALAEAILGEGGGLATPAHAARHLGPAMLMFGLPAAIGSGRLGEWRRARAASRDAITAPGDAGPALGVLLDGARFALGALAARRTPAAQTTCDIEWNGEAIG